MAAALAQCEEKEPTFAATLLVVSSGRDATARVLVRGLRAAGFQVFHAKDSATALAHIEQHRPAVMLMVQDRFGSEEDKFLRFATSLDQTIAILVVSDGPERRASSTEPAGAKPATSLSDRDGVGTETGGSGAPPEGTLTVIPRKTPLEHVVSIVRALTNPQS